MYIAKKMKKPYVEGFPDLSRVLVIAGQHIQYAIDQLGVRTTGSLPHSRPAKWFIPQTFKLL